MSSHLVRAIATVALLLAACEPAENGTGGTPLACTPSEAEWESTILPLITKNCGQCHGDSPLFGAPFSLTDYENLLAPWGDESVAARLATVVEAGRMPPLGSPSPTLDERDTLVAWASCDAQRVTDPTGLDVNRPPYVSAETAPAGLDFIDLTADNVAVSPTDIDRYEDLYFTNNVESDVFIRRFEIILDDTRVVHHVTLQASNPDSPFEKYLYAWAPGTGPFEFPEGGVRLRPTDELHVQIHYNNGAGFTDVTDASGVRLYIDEPMGSEYVMADLGPGASGFSIAARSEGAVSHKCTVNTPVTALAAMPHMHEIGADFALELERDGAVTSELTMGRWDFETQLFYELPLSFEAGDAINVRCGFDNPHDTEVSAGPRTEDEMCFAFTYVTPPVDNFCTAGPISSALEYSPGACFDQPVTAPPELQATITDAEPTFDAAGTLPDGHFLASNALLVTPTPSLLATVDFDLASQVRNAAGDFAMDMGLHIIAPTGNLSDGRQVDISYNGTVAHDALPATPTATCGTAPNLEFGLVNGQVAFRMPIDGGGIPVELTLWVFYDVAP